MARTRTDDNSVTYWFLWEHPKARRRGLEFDVFEQTPPKMVSAPQPYGPRRSIFFPPQNYNSQSIGSALRASPFASFGAFARKHNPNVGSALRASPLERRKNTRHQFFALSMSASRSRTWSARLRPRRVSWNLPYYLADDHFCMIHCQLILCSRTFPVNSNRKLA